MYSACMQITEETAFRVEKYAVHIQLPMPITNARIIVELLLLKLQLFDFLFDKHTGKYPKNLQKLFKKPALVFLSAYHLLQQ